MQQRMKYTTLLWTPSLSCATQHLISLCCERFSERHQEIEKTLFKRGMAKDYFPLLDMKAEKIQQQDLWLPEDNPSLFLR